MERHQGPICLLEGAPIMMETVNASTKTHGKLATLGVFHQTIREIEDLSQIPRPTFFRIWNRPLIANGDLGHGLPVFSKSRRLGW
jgi:hypothetical protein